MPLKACGMKYVYLRADGNQTIPNRLRLLKNVQMASLAKLKN